MNKLVCFTQKRVVQLALLTMVVLALPMAAHAQSGCTDSPENPTAVLALVGCAGACFSSVRRRLKARRSSSDK